MSHKWFYTCGGLIIGPVSTAEIRQALARKVLGPSDLIWPEGGGRALAVPARAAEGALADDCAGASATAPPAAAPTVPAPDWVEDVRQAEQAGHPPAAPPKAETPDWIGDLRLYLEAPAPGAPTPQPAAVPLARRVTPPAPDTRELQGMGAASGRNDSVPIPPQMPQEVFEAACVALRRWVDAEVNRTLIASGDLDLILQTPILQQFFCGLQKYGPEASAGVRRYLKSLVENRRRFYAFGKL